MEKETRRRIDRRIIYHIVSAAVLVGSLLFSVFYFRAVFSRTIQAFKDFGLSVAYYFTELSGFEGLITPTVGGQRDGSITVSAFGVYNGPESLRESSDFQRKRRVVFSGTVEGAFDVRQSGDPDSSRTCVIVAFNQKRIQAAE